MSRRGGGPPRLARTLSRSRWREYRSLLELARSLDYRIVSLEDWLRTAPSPGEPTLILRHDVDQHPRSALRMAAIEHDLGLHSTWYFRWRTAHPLVIRTLREGGFAVGLHYETLTRLALQGSVGSEIDDRLIERGREILRREIEAFNALYGRVRSVTPHGDSRVPGVSNAILTKRVPPDELGIEFDGNEAMRGRSLARWLTDRTAPDGGWVDGIDAAELLRRRAGEILCLTHPNNWVSGPSLWLDRALRAVLPPPPRPGTRGLQRPIRTGVDRPPS
jgi:hypothetical protein